MGWGSVGLYTVPDVICEGRSLLRRMFHAVLSAPMRNLKPRLRAALRELLDCVLLFRWEQ